MVRYLPHVDDQLKTNIKAALDYKPHLHPPEKIVAAASNNILWQSHLFWKGFKYL